jgi:hypothetical protein
LVWHWFGECGLRTARHHLTDFSKPGKTEGRSSSSQQKFKSNRRTQAMPGTKWNDDDRQANQ